MAEGNVLPTLEYLQSKWCSSKEPALDRLAFIIQAHDAERLDQFLMKTDWDVNQLFPIHPEPMKDVENHMNKLSTSIPSEEEISDDWIAAIHLVVDECWCEGLQVLIQAGADLNLCDYLVGRHLLSNKISLTTMFTPLMRAITLRVSSKVKRLKFVKDLLKHGADPNLKCPNTNLSMIALAVEFRHQPVVDLLLKKYRIDLTGSFTTDNMFRQDILLLACMKTADVPFWFGQRPPKTKLIKDLVNHGADVNAHSYDILDIICFHYHQVRFEILDMLFNAGIDINVVNMGYTMLHKAYRPEQRKIFRWLIRHGANTNLFSPKFLFDEIGFLPRRKYDIFHLFVQVGIKPLQGQIIAFRQHQSLGVLLRKEDLEVSDTNCNGDKLMNFMKWNRGRHVERQHQEADLREFSDETLHAYPEDLHMTAEKQVNAEQILAFLTEPPLLKWRCRQSIRQNLVSHSPTVVKSLCLPSALKRYILCHEL